MSPKADFGPAGGGAAGAGDGAGGPGGGRSDARGARDPVDRRGADPADRRTTDPADRRAAILKALKKQRQRLARKLEALSGDLAEAERSPLYRRYAEALLAYLKQVPAREARVTLPDPADPAGSLTIELDPAVKPQVNAARYFKRAAKGERGLGEIPPRIANVEAELHGLVQLIERAEHFDERAVVADGESVVELELDHSLDHDLERALAALPPAVRAGIPRGGISRGGSQAGGASRSGAAPKPSVRAANEAVASGKAQAPSARLQPRRLKSSEGWDVLIGRNNEGNDYVTHTLARPEDYWFHVHGSAGSHVVLRRGKGKNEPSKQTLAEVAGWAAFYSQARTAGTVPVIWTLKKYVRKPRRSPPGLAVCEREKTVMVKPREPKAEAIADDRERPIQAKVERDEE
ncbi:MAG: NFACT RNA binding domain-containing protein [Candidatus Eiseniibacteriota bacterium]